ncbi:MAG: class B sortase [Lachnospiraceae bacterium]|nr:class B sortase [Lachnospiraceae bacterium]
MSKTFFRIWIAVLAGIFLFSGYKLFSILNTYRVNAKNVGELQSIFHSTMDIDRTEDGQMTQEVLEDGTPAPIMTPEEKRNKAAREAIAALKAINPDTVAWIIIPGANVDHVIVQGTNDSWYLYRSFYEEPNDCGTMFMEAENKLGEPLQNYIIFGHRMKDGSMFAHLNVYLDQEFYDENPTFTMYFEDGEYECQVFAAYRCLWSDNYAQVSFASEEEMEQYIQTCFSRSEIQTDVVVEPGDFIVTLSTCDRPTDPVEGRLVIQAKLVKLGEQ